MRRALFLVAALSACGGNVAGEGADAAIDVTTVEEAALDSFVPDDTSVAPDTRDAAADMREVAPCDAGVTQCTNGIDDDGDGLVDWLDPECTGALDGDEGSFGRAISHEFDDPCKSDCIFDGNAGSGDDGCAFSGQCLPGSTHPRCPFDSAAYADPTQCPPSSEKCQSYCKRFVPNGCDCAGCCDVYGGAGLLARVRVLPGCSLDKLGDPAYCPSCEKRLDCNKPCNRCDYCIGKTTLPSDCTDAMKSACPPGAAACDAARPCPCGDFCLTGCCIRGS